MTPVGRARWAVAEGYIPAWSHGPAPEFESHETLCMLYAGEGDAHVTITMFYPDRAPVGPYRLTVDARRTRHVRLNELSDPEPVPRGHDFATVIESDVPIVVQHTRLESRQAENACSPRSPSRRTQPDSVVRCSRLAAPTMAALTKHGGPGATSSIRKPT